MFEKHTISLEFERSVVSADARFSTNHLAIMTEVGSYKISFSNGFDLDSVKLIELSSEVADGLESGRQTLAIRGGLDDNVVIVTENKT